MKKLMLGAVLLLSASNVIAEDFVCNQIIVDIKVEENIEKKYNQYIQFKMCDLTTSRITTVIKNKFMNIKEDESSEKLSKLRTTNLYVDLGDKLKLLDKEFVKIYLTSFSSHYDLEIINEKYLLNEKIEDSFHIKLEKKYNRDMVIYRNKDRIYTINVTKVKKYD